MRCAAALPGALLVLAACSTSDAHFQSDWERENAAALAKDNAAAVTVPLPSYPADANLAELAGRPASAFRFFVDRASLSVAEEGLVRYVIVARSPSGAQSTRYEGIACKRREYVVYAIGRDDGTWVRPATRWRAIAASGSQQVLHREYFCPRGIAIASAEEGRAALQRGGHPLAAQPNPVSGGN